MSNDLTLKSSSADKVNSVTSRRKAKQHFIDIGEWQKFEKPVMHHFLPCWKLYNIDRYNQWNVEDLIVMERSDHARLHCSFQDYSYMMGENNPAKREEVREKLSGENNPMYGVHRYGEDAPNYGRHHTEESKILISSNHDYKYGVDHPNYGKPRPDSTKQKISNTLKERGTTLGSNNGNAKPIRVTNLYTMEVKEFSYVKDPECAKYLNYKTVHSCSVSIHRALKNHNGLLQHRKFKVEYI